MKINYNNYGNNDSYNNNSINNNNNNNNNNSNNNNIKLVFPQCRLKRNVVPLLKVWITDYRYRTKESKC